MKSNALFHALRRIVLTVLLCCLASFSAISEGAVSGVFSYEDYEDGVRIYAVSNSVGSGVSFPETIDGKPVVSISGGLSDYTYNGKSFRDWNGNNVFGYDGDAERITWVELPSTLRSIEGHAFSRCRNLLDIDLPPSLQYIGEYAFSGCSFQSLVIPNGVTVIDFEAFYDCQLLESVDLPSSLNLIESCAFYNCPLRSLEIPSGVTHIGSYAFNGGMFETVEIPASVRTLGEYCLDSYGLHTIVFKGAPPKTIGYICGNCCYSHRCCDYEWHYENDPSVMGIYTHHLDMWTKVMSGNYDYSYDEGWYWVSGEPSTQMVSGQYTTGYNWNGLFMYNPSEVGFTYQVGRELYIYESDNYSGKCWYYRNVASLIGITVGISQTIVVPERLGGCPVIGIGYDSYSYYGYGNSLQINYKYNNPNYIETTAIVLPESVEHIASDAFHNLGLTKILLPSHMRSISEYAFINKGIEELVFPKGISKIPPYLCCDCYDLKTVVIPDGVTEIGESAFSRCGQLEVVSLPDSLVEIGPYAFGGTGLKSVIIPNRVTKICDGAFFVCGQLEEVILPEGLIELSGNPFYYTAIHSLTIPRGVTKIGSWDVFSGIEELRFEGKPPITEYDGGYLNQNTRLWYNTAYSNYWASVISVMGLTNALPYTPVHSGEGQIVGKADGFVYTFDQDGSSAKITGYEGNGGAVVIPQQLNGVSIYGIGKRAFYGHDEITSVSFEGYCPMIEDSAFERCHGLKSVDFPQCLSSIGNSAFRECTSLTNLVVGRNVGNIGVYAFRDCIRLVNVQMEPYWNSSGRKIGDGAFSGVPAFAKLTGSESFTVVVTEVVGNGPVAMTESWSAKYPSYREKFGNNFAQSVTKKTGKVDASGKDMLVWQDFVAGTDPTDINDKFYATIEIVDGIPEISYYPELPAEEKALREYKIFGKAKLSDQEWTDVSAMTGQERAEYNFFKVTVEMR